MASKEACIKEIKNKLVELEASGCSDNRELTKWRNLLASYEAGLFDDDRPPLPKWNKDDYLRPEYRQGGYFTSQDYYAKCEEFHKILAEHDVNLKELSRGEYIWLKKEFFKNTYGIIWLAEEDQFLPDANITVIVDRL